MNEPTHEELLARTRILLEQARPNDADTETIGALRTLGEADALVELIALGEDWRDYL